MYCYLFNPKKTWMNEYCYGHTCDAFLRHARLNKVFEVRCQTIADIFYILYERHVTWCPTHWSIIDHEKVVLSTLHESVSHYERWRATITSSISVNEYYIFFICIPIWWAQQPFRVHWINLKSSYLVSKTIQCKFMSSFDICSYLQESSPF